MPPSDANFGCAESFHSRVKGTLVGLDRYGDSETKVRKRLGAREPEEWSILAAAVAVGPPKFLRPRGRAAALIC